LQRGEDDDVLLVGEGADDGAEEHGGSEAGDEEAADVALVEAVLAVEVVDVGALQPVPGCANPSIHPSIIRAESRQHFADLNEGAGEGGREGIRVQAKGRRSDVHIMRE
jgi:hypothetical protein